MFIDTFQTVYNMFLKSSSVYRRFLTPLQQMTFENIVSKGENAHIEQILLLQKCFWTSIYQCSFIYRAFPYLWLNPFSHIDTFWRLCSRQLFENIVTKEEIAQNYQFLLLPQCFPLLVIVYPFNYRDFLFFDKICSKSTAAELSYEGKG